MRLTLSPDTAKAVEWTLAFLCANEDQAPLDVRVGQTRERPAFTPSQTQSNPQSPLGAQHVSPSVDHLRKPPSSWRGNHGV